MTEYDVVVIGGGPAGLSCAVMLQKKGFSTCVLEKKAYPRDKLCGGLITAKTYSLLLELFDGNADLLDGLCFETVKKVSLWDSDSCKARVSVTHEFRIVERKALDRTLKDLYVRNGGTVYDGEAVKSVDFDKKQVHTAGNAYRYQLLIAADGVHSTVRRQAGLSLDSLGFCLETYIPRAEIPVKDEIQIRFNVLEQGYGWVFPCGDFLKVGFGNSCRSRIDYKKEFEKYLFTLGIHDPQRYRPQGAFIPYGGYLDHAVLYGSVVFVGDSAGMVDPLCGEGLFYALSSGRNIAGSVRRGTGGIVLQPEVFNAKRKPETAQIRSGKKLRDLFYRPCFHRFFLNRIEKHEHFICFFLDSQVSLNQYPYSRIGKLLLDYLSEKKGRVKTYGS